MTHARSHGDGGRVVLRANAVGGSRAGSEGAGPNPNTGYARTSARATLRVAWLAMSITGAACASAPKVLPNVKGAAVELPPEEVYFPLNDGHIFQYTVQGQDGRAGLLVTKVSRDDASATLTSGERVVRLTVRSDGIYNESGHYVLKLPLVKGAEWSGQSGVVSVVRDGQTVETGAGKFVQCIVTREVTQGTVEVRSVETTFCPNVGLVRLEVQALGETLTEVEVATLQYFGPPVDIDAL